MNLCMQKMETNNYYFSRSMTEVVNQEEREQRFKITFIEYNYNKC